jgi:hypothetical protein
MPADSSSEPEFAQRLVTVSTKLEPSLRDAILKLAAAHDRTLGAEVRRAVRVYVESHLATGAA